MTTPTCAPVRHQPFDAGEPRAIPHRPIQIWLMTVAALVLAMIIVGGLTRLTESGLSITEWQPILGAIPPLSDADWQTAFAKYQTIPQFKSVNNAMSLSDFKFIFWWEWAHRFLGRFIGLALTLPFAGFWLSGRLTPALSCKLLALTCLVGIQGFAGWYMVKSGLADRIDVSPCRLALHLSLAFLILGGLVWLILDLSKRRPNAAAPALRRWAYTIGALVFAQVALGGLVAGLKAGRAFNTWPLMDGHLIPEDYTRLDPWWINFTENMATVQFNHRLIAYLIAGLALWHVACVFRLPGEPRAGFTAALLAGGVFAQMTLGIATVLAGVPLGLGIAHQGMAAIVFVIAVTHAHGMAYTGATS